MDKQSHPTPYNWCNYLSIPGSKPNHAGYDFWFLISEEKWPRHIEIVLYLFLCINLALPTHYINVIMTTMASQITSLAVVYSSVYLDADQRKHQSSASLAFVWGIHRDRWIPRTKGQLRGKCFHLMTSSWDTSIASWRTFRFYVRVCKKPHCRQRQLVCEQLIDQTVFW